MGVVFEARQLLLNRKVALKVLSGGLGLTGKGVQRFHGKVEAAAKLHHSNVITVYATGCKDDSHYYAMELIDGPSLDRVVHRDMKPSNLLLSPDGRLSINDFGLARLLEEPGITMTGEFVGTPAYMSPEQITSGRVPLFQRTDIYSLRAALYELLTLQLPFTGERVHAIIKASAPALAPRLW
jgi:serine/threonine protein kinase